jgi:hypothetical protein
MRRALVAALLAPLALPLAAQARTERFLRFVSPSKRISCHAVKYGGPALECSSPDIRRIGELDPYFLLRRRGRTVYGQRGDYDGYNVRPRTLRYGAVWRRSGVTCRMRTSGLTCRNRSGHGFHLARGDVRRF